MPPRSRFAALLSVLAAGLVLLSGPGTRLGLWEFSTGFVLLRWGAYLGLAAAGLGLISLLWRGREERRWLPLFALVLGLASALVPWRWMQQARGVPPIHDITTDTERPPEFVAVLPLRADAPNPATYGGPEVALAQRRGYPDLGPLMLDATPAAAFSLALEAAREMDWELVAADSGSGRIEATATTPWFGFKDDVVVRVSSAGSGSRIDVRSVSRVGGSDVGANAERIRA
ncbi:MAG: DUF1499 domain-containing protein, partial [Gemmatimonadales bacterium]|nr:DUF1499 domain-containing protein [Gemmatimonadales bacterium]